MYMYMYILYMYVNKYIYIYICILCMYISVRGEQLPKGIYSLVFQRGSRISPFFKNLDWTSEFTLLFFITYIMSKFRRFSGEESIRDLSVLVPTLNIEASSILFRLPLWRRAGLGQGHRVDEFWHSHGTWPGCRLIFTDQLWFSVAMWNYQSAGKSMSLLHDSWDPFVGKPSTKRSKQHSALWHQEWRIRKKKSRSKKNKTLGSLKKYCLFRLNLVVG